MFDTAFHALAATLSEYLPPAYRAEPKYAAVAAALTLALGAYLCYRYLFGNARKQAHYNTLFTNERANFDKLRRKTYPPAYPNAWIKLADLDDIANGRVHSVTACGLHLVVFLSKGTPVVMDAFCPHLGAHLGMGGTVNPETGSIVCPFHGWDIAGDGCVKHIPYCTGDLPKGKVTRTYRCRTWMGMVMFWFHAENFSAEAKHSGEDELVPPSWELKDMTCAYTRTGEPDCPEKQDVTKWERFNTYSGWHNQHVMEMPANAPDAVHFNVVHGIFNVEVPWIDALLKKFLKIEHVTDMFTKDEPGLEHHLYFDNFATTIMCGVPLTCVSQMTHVDIEGPGVLHFHIVTPIGSVHLVKCLTPVDEFRTYCEDAWYRDERIPLWIAHLIARVAKGALVQDGPIWENKIWLGTGAGAELQLNPDQRKQLLVKGDGPFGNFGRWYRQHYSEFSAEWADQVREGKLTW